MSNDNKTLTDVQPGGRVRLGDQAERARFEAWCASQRFPLGTSRMPTDSNEYRSLKTREAWRVWQAALAARQPVGEPVPVVVPGAPTRCRHCESTDLEWFAHVRAVNDVPHGRLTTHDVGCVFVLGCNECSETLHTVKADSIASLLAAPPAQAVDLAENMLSVLIEEGVLARNGRVFQKLRILIDSQAVGK